LARCPLPADLDGARTTRHLPVLRDRLPDVLTCLISRNPAWDGNRETTNVPVQALYLMNSCSCARARGLANRLTREAPTTRIVSGVLSCCASSAAAADEVKVQPRSHQGRKLASEDEKAYENILAGFCQALLSTAEFRNID
jgi:hypothetical protein